MEIYKGIRVKAYKTENGFIKIGVVLRKEEEHEELIKKYNKIVETLETKAKELKDVIDNERTVTSFSRYYELFFRDEKDLKIIKKYTGTQRPYIPLNQVAKNTKKVLDKYELNEISEMLNEVGTIQK